MAPGVHSHVTSAEYHRLPAVNSGLVRCMVERCPAAARFESWLNPERPPDEKSDAMSAGTIAHALLLEGDNSRVVVIDPFKYPAKSTGAIPTGWTNAAIRAARDDAYAAGKLPILANAWAEVEAMVVAARAYLDGLVQSEPEIHAAFLPDGGDSELSITWNDNGVPCRIRPDRISKDRRLIVDYKTSGTAEPNLWGRTQLIRMGYYESAAFYRRGVRAAFNVEPDYVFLVQECDPPYLCSLVGMDPAGVALGAAKMDHGLSLWRKCLASDRWPAYPDRVQYVELPAWESARWEEAQALAAVDALPDERP